MPLLSSIAGGVLVLTGQFFTRRAEDRRQWLLRFHEAAADLAASYLQEAALVNDSRRSGRHEKEDVATTTYVVDQKKALSRFRALPWGSMFEVERRAMGKAIENLWRAWDESDDVFQTAYDDARNAVSHFTSPVGEHLLNRRRSSKPT